MTLRAAVMLTRVYISKSLRVFPFWMNASTQRGFRPRPVHVWLGSSGLAYFAATFDFTGAIATISLKEKPNDFAVFSNSLRAFAIARLLYVLIA